MRVLFLIAAFVPFILSVEARRSTSRYICQLSYKHHQKTFYLGMGEKKEVSIGGWLVQTGIRKTDKLTTVSLRRTVTVLDANYQRQASRAYPTEARELEVELNHSFGGQTDVFTMSCYPRE